MNHNDVARRTAREMPARSLIPRTLAFDAGVGEDHAPGLRDLLRPMPPRAIVRTGGGGR
ncbi:hypothetical protein [Kitasatospora sp. NPDC092286]|uniref:hypothetical protein n=1 Tax=Kitasatospora sp. NPDC092286 TaxID=3364087 RepID=UPI0037F5A613